MRKKITFVVITEDGFSRLFVGDISVLRLLLYTL